MACYHPLLAINTGQLTRNGKLKLSFIKNTQENRDHYKGNCVELPCGQCIGCRLDHSRQWANRCMNEAKYYEKNYFITLTYDDDHYPLHGSISKREFTDFIKRFRKTFNDRYEKYCHQHGLVYEYVKIRFFGCGEYGDKSFRPHYHFIAFNCPLFDLTTHFPYEEVIDGSIKTKVVSLKNKDGAFQFYSPLVADVWQKGHIVIDEVNWDTCAYVARYVTKKLNGPEADLYKQLEVEPPFVNMSRMPGIGYRFFEDNQNDLYVNHEMFITRKGQALKTSPGKYYDRKRAEQLDDLGLADELLRKRRAFSLSKERSIAINASSDYTLDRLRENQEHEKLDKIKILKRSL